MIIKIKGQGQLFYFKKEKKNSTYLFIYSFQINITYVDEYKQRLNNINNNENTQIVLKDEMNGELETRAA